MGLLDFSAAFDWVDHSLLLKRLQLNFGFVDTVLCWLTFFVTGRTQQIQYDGQLSPTTSVVPQGSVLGPLLFVLYTAELSQVVTAHGLTLHQYADDYQIYITTSIIDALASVSRFAGCIDDVAVWMSASRLRLNPTKTKNPMAGVQVPSGQDRHSACAGSVNLSQSGNTARDLGVFIDRSLTMSDHVAAVCRAAFLQLRQLRRITHSLTVDAAKSLLQAFITCRLDCCNSLFSGIMDSLFRRLQ